MAGGTSKFIKSVTYHLDEGFDPCLIRLNEAPFQLARNGWGTFELEVDIHFHDWTKLKPIRGITHQLEWHPYGKWKVIQVAIDNLPQNGSKNH